MFSSRFMADKPENPLFNFLSSFCDNTNKEERELTELLIKFDEDDELRPEKEELDHFGLNIRTFVWPRHGGRASIHEVNNILYKFASKDCKFVQFIADDFIFTRPNFVTEILERSDEYVMTGENGLTHHECIEGTAGYCPAFSSKLIDALSCTVGPQSNADGVAFEIADSLRERYNYEIMFAPGNNPCYYTRTDCITSAHDPEDTFTKMTFPHGNTDQKGHWKDYFRILADNVMRAMLVEKNGGLEKLLS